MMMQAEHSELQNALFVTCEALFSVNRAEILLTNIVANTMGQYTPQEVRKAQAARLRLMTCYNFVADAKVEIEDMLDTNEVSA